MSSSYLIQPRLVESRGSACRYIGSTIPLLGGMLVFLFQASKQKRRLENYLTGGNENNDDNVDDDVDDIQQGDMAVIEGRVIASLRDIMAAFLIFHVFWTLIAVYTLVFIPKRRHLIGRYLTEGELCLGDVVHDNKRSMRPSFFHYCNGRREYGYAIYPHPNRQGDWIRKRVRVYQHYTRERIAILTLPNRPFSGQCKVDSEIDLSASNRERDGSLKVINRWNMFWVLFTLLGSVFVLLQFRNLGVGHEKYLSSCRVFLIVVGLNIPMAFLINWIRWLFYRSWMTNRGCLNGKIDTKFYNNSKHTGFGTMQHQCTGGTMVASVDGSDMIPYSILKEEELSYQGTLPIHPEGGCGDASSACSNSVDIENKNSTLATENMMNRGIVDDGRLQV